MTHAPVNMFSTRPPMLQSNSSFTKRKRNSWAADEDEASKHIRVCSPTMQQSYPLPDLMTDHSNSASDDDQTMDHDGDMDMDSDMNVHMAMGMSNTGAYAHDHQEESDRGMQGYMFASGGSGGFGFGPGAEEDELEMMDDMGASTIKSSYPGNYSSLTPHPNPNHFSNPHYQSGQNIRASSPLAAQAFSTGLPAPAPRGLMQPASAGPVAFNASDVEKARNQHGPGCKSIPKLVMSDYPDPVTGNRSMWSICGDCGACEMAQ
ncbi:hypothetical protein IAU60_004178 [Kwoniella sp. DSM 27419]